MQVSFRVPVGVRTGVLRGAEIRLRGGRPRRVTGRGISGFQQALTRLAPVRRYRPPRIPTKAEALQHPDLLKALPKRWRSSPAVLGALAAVGALGCGNRGHAPSPGATTASSAPRPARHPLAKVAPIFLHGRGVASTGGVAATRIAFLTEDEALAVVVDEAAKAGLHFKLNARTFAPVDVPVTSEFEPPERRKGAGSLPLSRTRSPTLDGSGEARSVSFELVSREDAAGRAAHEEGVYAAEVVVIVADGGSGIWELFDELLPSTNTGRVVRVLDGYHAASGASLGQVARIHAHRHERR